MTTANSTFLYRFNDFPGADASGADIGSLIAAVGDNSNSLDIRHKCAFCSIVCVAYIIANGSFLAAY